jgi:amino acid transporter
MAKKKRSKRFSPLSLVKSIFIGKPKDPEDKNIFHQISLIAFFAWIGLGADPLSSSAYGPEQAFKIIVDYPFLSIFIGLAIGVTVFIISASYFHVIELFPNGGGGYVAATKLLSPKVGMVSGCALLVDYVLTISVSLSSCSAAIFSFLPPEWYQYRIYFALFCVIFLIYMNLRGAKESVKILMPIFILFLVTHAIIIAFGFVFHISNVGDLVASTGRDINKGIGDLGLAGLLVLFFKAYSMGAGTYTGIDTISNGMPLLREPRVVTAKKTMKYMAISLSIMALGLMVLYLLFNVKFAEGKTLNASAFASVLDSWPDPFGSGFLFLLLASEGALLFVAAQGGFLAGPRVLANMAIDRWMPWRFSMLSDRLVTQHGVLLMGVAAFLTIWLTSASVDTLIILYSINVFITFTLTQLGMVRHWWRHRKKEKRWFNKMLINGVGLILCSSILVSVVYTKFYEGGWLTLVITGAFALFCIWVNGEYKKLKKQLKRLDSLVSVVNESEKLENESMEDYAHLDKKAVFTDKTAVLLVNGFNGTGLHSLFAINKLIGFSTFRNYVFIQVGNVNASNFKSTEEINSLREYLDKSVNTFALLMRKSGYYTETYTAIGADTIDEIIGFVPAIRKKFPNSVFFGGQIVFKSQGFMRKMINNLLHNNILTSVQERLYDQGIAFVFLPLQM